MTVSASKEALLFWKKSGMRMHGFAHVEKKCTSNCFLHKCASVVEEMPTDGEQLCGQWPRG